MSKFLWISSRQQSVHHTFRLFVLSTTSYLTYFPRGSTEGAVFPFCQSFITHWRCDVSSCPRSRPWGLHFASSFAGGTGVSVHHHGPHGPLWSRASGKLIAHPYFSHKVHRSLCPQAALRPCAGGAVLNRKITTRETEKNIEPNRLPKGCSQELSQESRVSPCWPGLRTHIGPPKCFAVLSTNYDENPEYWFGFQINLRSRWCHKHRISKDKDHIYKNIYAYTNTNVYV